MFTPSRWSQHILVILIGLLCGGPGWALTQVFQSPDVPQQLVDNSTAYSWISVADMPSYVTDVNVTLDIEHEWPSDLHVYLYNPTGHRVELFSQVNNPSGGFYGTVLDDQAVLSVRQGDPCFPGTYRPEGFLGEFIGVNPNGPWVLEIRDRYSFDQGTLNAWSLEITAGEPRGWTDAVMIEQVYRAYDLVVSGSQVVWHRRTSDTDDYEIHLYDADTGVLTPLTNNTTDDKYPDICGETVVWQGDDGHDWEIYAYDTKRQTFWQVTNNDDNDTRPKVSGSFITYKSDNGGDSEVVIADLHLPISYHTTTDNYNAGVLDISGSYVVWDVWDSSDQEIHSYDVMTSTALPITSNSQPDSGPVVSGVYVVWTHHDGADWDIWYSPVTVATPQALENNGGEDNWPAIYGHHVVWSATPAAPGSQAEIYARDIDATSGDWVTSNSVVDDFPAVSGEYAVFHGAGTGKYEIHGFDLETLTTSQLSGGPEISFNQPRISGNTVAWQGWDGAQHTIYVRRRIACATIPADLNADCVVNLLDVASLADAWLECGWIPENLCPK